MQGQIYTKFYIKLLLLDSLKWTCVCHPSKSLMYYIPLTAHNSWLSKAIKVSMVRPNGYCTLQEIIIQDNILKSLILVYCDKIYTIKICTVYSNIIIRSLLLKWNLYWWDNPNEWRPPFKNTTCAGQCTSLWWIISIISAFVTTLSVSLNSLKWNLSMNNYPIALKFCMEVQSQ